MVYGNRTTEAQSAQRTADIGGGQGDKRIERLCGSAAVNLSRGSMRQYTVVYGNKTTESQSARRTNERRTTILEAIGGLSQVDGKEC